MLQVLKSHGVAHPAHRNRGRMKPLGTTNMKGAYSIIVSCVSHQIVFKSHFDPLWPGKSALSVTRV